MRLILSFLAIMMVSGQINTVQAHCQIPCGIYGDERIFDEMDEHVTTIEKSMAEIKRLQSETPQDIHMISRWTANKEKHAQELQDIIGDYFLAQRVKAPADDASDRLKTLYADHLQRLHQIIVLTMKTKQTLDEAQVAALKEAIKGYENLYFMPVEEHIHKTK